MVNSKLTAKFHSGTLDGLTEVRMAAAAAQAAQGVML